MDDKLVGRRERYWDVLKDTKLGVDQVVDLANSLAGVKAAQLGS